MSPDTVNEFDWGIATHGVSFGGDALRAAAAVMLIIITPLTAEVNVKAVTSDRIA
jgi:hypothetical protein